MVMKKHYYILLYILLSSASLWATTNPKDSTAVQQKTITKTVVTDLNNLELTVRQLSQSTNSANVVEAISGNHQYRSFPELDNYTTTSFNDQNGVAEFTKEYPAGASVTLVLNNQ